MDGIHIGLPARERDWTRAALVMLSALLIGALGFAAAQTARLKAANARVDAVVQKAFYETCELTEGLSVNFRKLLVASEPGQIQSLLNEAALQTQGAIGNLSLLPLGHETVSATLKFINQAGDYAASLSARLGDGGAVTAGDRETLAQLSETAAAFAVGMGRLLDRYEAGERVFDAGDFEPTGREDLYPLTSPAGDYPVLLYDGPFSDGCSEGVFRRLEGLADVDEGQARRALAAYAGVDIGELTSAGESDIPVPCYEYRFRRDGVNLSAGVTRAGGEVLYMLCEDDVKEANLTRLEAVDAARAFLLSRDYGEMEMSYASRYEGILTVNFAAVQDGVILYPDLVKVQVSLRDGAIVGVEAAGYLMNHVPRALPRPALSEADALERVGEALTPRSTRLCVIPRSQSEALCYEIRAESGEDTFLVYIDAMTGAERELLQLISDENGSLVT